MTWLFNFDRIFKLVFSEEIDLVDRLEPAPWFSAWVTVLMPCRTARLLVMRAIHSRIRSNKKLAHPASSKCLAYSANSMLSSQVAMSSIAILFLIT